MSTVNTDSYQEVSTASPAVTERRKVLLAGAWAVPTLAVAVAAPIAAASTPCPQLPEPSGWDLNQDGQLGTGSQPQFNNQWGGAYIPLSMDNANSIISVQDRNLAQGVTLFTLQAQFTPVSGTAYTLTFPVRADTTLVDEQIVRLSVGGTQVWSAATKGGVGETVILGNAEQTYTANWTAPNNLPTTVQIQFEIPSNGVANQNNDDIRIGMPVISTPNCIS